jgi:hypothetical protein
MILDFFIALLTTSFTCLNTTFVLIINFRVDQLVLAKLKASQNQINLLRTQKIIVILQQKYNINTMKEKQI